MLPLSSLSQHKFRCVCPVDVILSRERVELVGYFWSANDFVIQVLQFKMTPKILVKHVNFIHLRICHFFFSNPTPGPINRKKHSGSGGRHGALQSCIFSMLSQCIKQEEVFGTERG